MYALQGMETPRPMTHDLFKTVLDDLAVKLERVEITELHDGTFYAEIELDRDGTKSRISSRPSDAIALAVRFGGEIPIFADEDVLDEAGVLFEADEEEHEVEQFREFLDESPPKTSADPPAKAPESGLHTSLDPASRPVADPVDKVQVYARPCCSYTRVMSERSSEGPTSGTAAARQGQERST